MGVMDCKDIWHVPARQPNKSLNRTRITASLSCLPVSSRVRPYIIAWQTIDMLAVESILAGVLPLA